MWHIAARGNRIYYEEFGNPSAPPLLLVHGSTLTGAHDYVALADTARRFARRHRVIVPDCPGHGRSDAVWLDDALPTFEDGSGRAVAWGGRIEYSFSAMARDLAGLLVAIRAAPAFVIGHSNGGNVALYLAHEQPACARAAVLLAANAYIDPHVGQRVPRNMNPQRVERERPEWMHEMAELHDAHHGPGYWRLLLRATIIETVTNPNWTRDDLRTTTTPCLCVQGELDVTNAPGKHAQTLAAWLPNAQLWIPEGIGHSVHHEIPDEFERRVSTFFATL